MPGETTGVSAAAGGAVGAGLGAIVGNQTGNAVEGIAVGAAAGAATGAMIGNALQAQNEAIALQDEAIERQQQLIQAQGTQIQELRRLSSDNVEFRDERRASWRGNTASSVENTYGSVGASQGFQGRAISERSGLRNGAQDEIIIGRGETAQRRAPMITGARKVRTGESTAPVIVESNLLHTDRVSVQRDNLEASQRDTGVTLTDVGEEEIDVARARTQEGELSQPGDLDSSKFQSADCQRALREGDEAERVGDSADKLFHYRRALRLCPENPRFHNGLGEVYLKMGRSDDARFEFKEALRLEPSYALAKSNLRSLSLEADSNSVR